MVDNPVTESHTSWKLRTHTLIALASLVVSACASTPPPSLDATARSSHVPSTSLETSSPPAPSTSRVRSTDVAEEELIAPSTTASRSEATAAESTTTTGRLVPEQNSDTDSQFPEVPSDPAALLAQALSGRSAILSWRELDRPIYGWGDLFEVVYCANGTTAVNHTGERLTPLDNIDRRSSFNQGWWRVDGHPSGDGRVALVHDYDTGDALVVLGWIDSSTVLHFEDPAWSMQVLGSSGC